MNSILKSSLGTLVLSVAFLMPARSAHANPDLYEKVLQSTALILVPQGDGKDMVGTCWVIDHERKLVITNNHVVGDKKSVDVFFPMFVNGEVVPLRDVHLKSGKKTIGQVIFRDPARDLALVRLDFLPRNARALPLASKSARPGETVHSVGNSGYNGGVLWRYTNGQVRLVAPFTIKIKASTVKATVVETQGPINQGDSGGPVVNDRGDIIGVVSSFNNQDRLITWNIDVREVRSFFANAERVALVEVADAH